MILKLKAVKKKNYQVYQLKLDFLLSIILPLFVSKKYKCSGPPTFISQRVGYQSNQKLLHHC